MKYFSLGPEDTHFGARRASRRRWCSSRRSRPIRYDIILISPLHIDFLIFFFLRHSHSSVVILIDILPRTFEADPLISTHRDNRSFCDFLLCIITCHAFNCSTSVSHIPTALLSPSDFHTVPLCFRFRHLVTAISLHAGVYRIRTFDLYLLTADICYSFLYRFSSRFSYLSTSGPPSFSVA